jgi:protein phosphatase
MRLSVEEIHWVGQRIPIPGFSVTQMTNLITTAKAILSQEARAVLDLPLPAWIIGDLHGNFHDLLRVLATIGDFSCERLIFLGDYVDRGDYSLEVILLLITLKCQHPRNIYLLRGNHEFAAVNGTYGFKQELDRQYPESNLWELFNDMFNYLPFAAMVGLSYICLHGGIGPSCPNIDAIRQIPIPIDCQWQSHQNGDIVSDIVWSDPEDQLAHFADSQRGRGSLFGSMALNSFLRDSNAAGLIRAHQCVKAGLEPFHHARGMTVFSCSNYSDKGNWAGFMHIAEGGQISSHQLQPLHDVVPRADAHFEAKANPLEKGHRPSASMTSLSAVMVPAFMRPRLPAALPVPKGKSAILPPLSGKRTGDAADTRREGVRLLIRSSGSSSDLTQWSRAAGLIADPDA